MSRVMLHCSLLLAATVLGCSSHDDGGNAPGACDGGQVASLVVDLWPGSAPAEPNALLVFDDRLYFVANDGVHGEELWSYRPASGAARVADIVPGSGGSGAAPVAMLGGKLYFSATDGVLGRELWVFDPADPDAGVALVADILPGAGDGYRGTAIVVDDTLYFTADDGAHGLELWALDADSGPFLAADLRPGADGASYDNFIDVDGVLYFNVYDGRRRDLWYVDPSSRSAIRVDIAVDAGGSGVWHDDPAVLHETLYFSADDGVHGQELWSHHPSVGAVLVADINPGSASSYPSSLTAMGSRLYMAADDGISGNELWVYDPTSGVELAADLFPGPDTGLRDSGLVVLDGVLYFRAHDDVHGTELWRYDPATGAELVVDTVPGIGGNRDDDPEPPSRPYVFDGRLYFSAFDRASDNSRAPWVYEPSTGATRLSEAWPGSGVREVPRRVTELDGRWYFPADDSVHGRELWVYDPGCAG